ncbi:hypothetical protein GYMLUDRAFT_67018 [Collybiopsis luxurians FD-317 M1]|nr:hypothetical protein GYMLUDRAFT_67018 [Collybiopsis luxurians FD-317 M1]
MDRRVSFSTSETNPRVSFGAMSDSSRRYAPHHRNSIPARSIMRTPKVYARHSLDLSFTTNLAPKDISNTRRRRSYRPMRPSSPAQHYVGARRHGHSSSVLSVAPLSAPRPRSPSHQKRHSSSGNSSSSASRRPGRSASVLSQPQQGGHRRSLSETFKALLGSDSHVQPSKSVSSPRMLAHRRSSSVGSSFVVVQSPANVYPRDRSTPLESSNSVNRGHPSPFPSPPVPSFNLQDLGYALPTAHSMTPMAPSPPHNSFTESSLHWSSLPESDPWTPSHSFLASPLSGRVHIHSELLSNAGHTLRWNMMLPPQTALSAFNASLDFPSSATKELLRSPACPGSAKITIVPATNIPALALWMQHWGAIEVYSSDTTFTTDITVFEVLKSLYTYFQQRLSSQAIIELPVESRQRIAHARARRVVVEGQRVGRTEWDKPPKRVDVLALWSVFGGLDVRYRLCHGCTKLDEPGWRVVELELKLKSL